MSALRQLQIRDCDVRGVIGTHRLISLEHLQVLIGAISTESDSRAVCPLQQSSHVALVDETCFRTLLNLKSALHLM